MKIKFKQPTIPQLVFIAGIIGAVLSIFLWYSHLTTRVIGCLAGGCEVVLASKYAKIFGVPIAAWGLAYYGALLLVTFFRLVDDRPVVRLFSWAVSLTGVFASGYFFYLEIVKIHAICSWCKVSTALTIALFIMAIIEIKKFGGVKGILTEVKTVYNSIHG